MKQLLIATTNKGKLREFRTLLSGLEVVLVTPTELNLTLNVAEDGDTYADNAALKAQAFSQASGLVSLADDSGLEVDALGGAPGLHSARFSPRPGATDADRRALLLRKLGPFPRPWNARFRCVVALAAKGRSLSLSEGICEGEVIPEERGENGFGYDPIFFIHQAGQTMAELTLQEKNRLSHRSRAVQAAIPELLRWLQT